MVDEVQRTPPVLNEGPPVDRLIETAGLRIILTASSARSLRRRGVNLLGGRARTRHLYPMTAAEAGSDFALERAMIHGQLPSVYTQPDPASYLASYVENFLFDAGVYRAIRPAGPLGSPEEIGGPALETLVFQELRAAIAYRSRKLDR